MTAFNVTHKTTFTVELLRDQVRVIDRRPGNLNKLRKGLSKLHGILDTMPLSKDTASDFKKTRESGVKT